jgi:hypothetical protein
MYGRSGLLVLIEIVLSEVDLICFPAYEMGVARSPCESPRDRWEEYLPVAISNIRPDRLAQHDRSPVATGARL